MNPLLTQFKRLVGIDIRSDKYTYAKDPNFGYTATSRVPEKWVKTTCGYCSVGCGMLLGVRDNKAVAVRGNPDHPVNRGKLCPKGLSEHHILSAPGRAKQPLLRKNGVLTPVSWDEALDTMAERFRDIQLRHDLDARNQRTVQRLLRAHDVAQGAIDTKTHDRRRLERFDMNIRRLFTRRLRQQRVDHADDRRVVFRFEQILYFGNVLHQPR